MTTFIDVFPNARVRLDAVREVRDGPGEYTVTLVLDGGAERWAKRADWLRACDLNATRLLPAAPGTFRLFYAVLGEDDIQVMREPVIAWEAKPACELIPVCMLHRWDRPGAPIVEFPDGTVQTEESIYFSQEAWLYEVKLIHKSECSAPEQDTPTKH
jgi:hypothetical protein